MIQCYRRNDGWKQAARVITLSFPHHKKATIDLVVTDPQGNDLYVYEGPADEIRFPVPPKLKQVHIQVENDRTFFSASIRMDVDETDVLLMPSAP